MNKELFDSMQQQMTPSPQVRAALREKLAQLPKKRGAPWIKYGAAAACAALILCAYPAFQTMQEMTQSPLHSYVMLDGATDYVKENTATSDRGSGVGGYHPTVPNTGDLPNETYTEGDTAQGEAVHAYQKLMAHFSGELPDWYGGAYLNDSGYMTVLLVSSKDPGDKSLELQVLDWVDNGPVVFDSAKYSLAHLKGLMDRLNELPETDPKCGEIMAGWGIDEERNQIQLTLTEVSDHILSVLADLDPEDDAILVKAGQRVSFDLGGEAPVSTDSVETPVSHDVIPGGATVPDDDLIADEPWAEPIPEPTF